MLGKKAGMIIFTYIDSIRAVPKTALIHFLNAFNDEKP